MGRLATVAAGRTSRDSGVVATAGGAAGVGSSWNCAGFAARPAAVTACCSGVRGPIAARPSGVIRLRGGSGGRTGIEPPWPRRRLKAPPGRACRRRLPRGSGPGRRPRCRTHRGSSKRLRRGLPVTTTEGAAVGVSGAAVGRPGAGSGAAVGCRAEAEAGAVRGACSASRPRGRGAGRPGRRAPVRDGATASRGAPRERIAAPFPIDLGG